MLEMERSLRQVNIDYQQVGFYQSTYLNTHCDRNFLDSVFDYLEEMNEAIALIYGLFTKLIHIFSFHGCERMRISCEQFM